MPPRAPSEDRSDTYGLIGFGALARRLIADFKPGRVRWVVLARNRGSFDPTSENVRLVTSLDQFVAAGPRAVVEVAGQGAVADFVPSLLEAGIPVVLASVGALAEPELGLKLHEARRSSGAELVLPAGSVGGLDYLGAVARLADARIRYTSRKPLAAWTAELAARGFDDASGEVVLFEGTPEDAAKLYPRNLNAAVAIALAAHPAPLTVRVIADPHATGNTHEIEAESSAGSAFMRFVNVPEPDNPKTSAITALSLMAALRTIANEEESG